MWGILRKRIALSMLKRLTNGLFIFYFHGDPYITGPSYRFSSSYQDYLGKLLRNRVGNIIVTPGMRVIHWKQRQLIDDAGTQWALEIRCRDCATIDAENQCAKSANLLFKAYLFYKFP